MAQVVVGLGGHVQRGRLGLLVDLVVCATLILLAVGAPRGTLPGEREELEPLEERGLCADTAAEGVAETLALELVVVAEMVVSRVGAGAVVALVHLAPVD